MGNKPKSIGDDACSPVQFLQNVCVDAVTALRVANKQQLAFLLEVALKDLPVADSRARAAQASATIQAAPDAEQLKFQLEEAEANGWNKCIAALEVQNADFSPVRIECAECGAGYRHALDCTAAPMVADPAGAPVIEYTNAMGEAGEKYLDSFPYAHPLPAQWRWADLWGTMLAATVKAVPSEARIANLEAALRYYAEGNHFMLSDPDAWDTVSGEPFNFQCDEAGTATVEDGSIAKMVLAGELMPKDDEEIAVTAPKSEGADAAPLADKK